MDIKKSKITINLDEEEKNTFNNFYDFLDDMARELYEAEAEHTELCTTITHIMEEIMTLYDFWGNVLEEKLKDKETPESWDYIHEMTEKFLFYDYDNNLIPYPTTTIGLKVGEWIDEFWRIHNRASSLRIVGELSKPAFDFFITYTEFPLLGSDAGYYIHETWTRQWVRIYSNTEKMKFVEELDSKYCFTESILPITFLSTTNFIEWKEDFLEQSKTFTDLIITNPLSDKAKEFFTKELDFNLPYKQGTYTYDSETGKWSKT